MFMLDQDCPWPFQNIMAQYDRWTLKVLSLPVFQEAFSQAVLASPLADPAFVIALDADSATDFQIKIHEFKEALEASVAERLLTDLGQLEQFWSLVVAAEKGFFQSTATQLGFGLCEHRDPPAGGSLIDKLKKEAAIKSLVSKPMGECKKSRLDPEVLTNTPLLDKEQAERSKWGARLEAIGRRAGRSSKLMTFDDQSDELSSFELAKLKSLVLVSGAPRTMAVHIKSFEKWELWTANNAGELYPINIDKVLKYCISLDQRECGPSVIPAFKISLKWVASRLAIDLPDLDDRRLRSLQESVVVNRAKTLKEAKPFPIDVIGPMEEFVCSDRHEQEARIFVWWVLCMIYASLRFDDAVHVKPADLTLKDEGLFGVAWQTKVDRRRRGTRFVIPAVGFRCQDWLEVGWELFQEVLPGERDYWIPELNTRDAFLERPPSYLRSVQWMRCLAARALNYDTTLHAWPKAQALDALQHLTAHSCRVTLLDAAVHAGRSTEEIGLQANWKNPGPLVLKYTRNRSSVPATMIKQLVQELAQSEHPVVEDEATVLDDVQETDLAGTEFFIKAPSRGSSYDYKYHAVSVDDQSLTACKKFVIDECSSVGNILPDLSVFCKACARQRQDICRFFENN